jgi:radical SAM superfamily enzyme YgiQ (UPF0313 family)
MALSRQSVLLAQLPIPPPGPQPIRANIPLAAGYLKLFARQRGLEDAWPIEILPPELANTLGDEGLAEAILARRPGLVGMTCYLWNIDRTLWLARRLKQQDPELAVVLGGPEITWDNHWVLDHPAVDYAVIGEGEQTFAELLEALGDGRDCREIPGLWAKEDVRARGVPLALPVLARIGTGKARGTHAASGAPRPRTPLAALDGLSSPYLEGILDAADENTMFLETVRGCVFKCKFCYYPKSYDALYFVSREKIAANLRYAAERGVREIVLLDPTLNQRPDFADFLRLLAEHNPDRQITFFGELRGEGINDETARLLREANFSEVEIGLQSLDPRAQQLMDRKVNLKAFERGARALLDVGISVRVDLILGLPGDTPDSFRQSLDYLHRSELYTDVQVFNLSILPGTAFRHEAAELGLAHQPWPPYYVLKTPTLSLDDIYGLMAEAQEAFGLEFDPLPPPVLDFPEDAGVGEPVGVCRIDLEATKPPAIPPAARRAQAFTLWLRSADFDAASHAAAGLVRQLLAETPHTTLQVVLEPDGPPERLTERGLAAIQAACFESTSYLDRFYSLHPNGLLGAKRLVVLAPLAERTRLGGAWSDAVGQFATLVWHGGPVADEELAAHEYAIDAR